MASRRSPLPISKSRASGNSREEKREAADQELVAAIGGEARDGADHRRRREPELLAHLLGPAALGEALDLHDAVDPEERARDHARGAAAPLDLGAHRDRAIGASIERAGGPAARHRARIVKRPHEGGGPPTQPTQPVVVGVMAMDDVHSLGAHQAPDAPHVAQEPARIDPRVERQARHGGDPGLARLVLEVRPGNEPEEDAMAPGAEPANELDDGIRAARPPAIGDEVQHDERPRLLHAADRSVGAADARSSP